MRFHLALFLSSLILFSDAQNIQELYLESKKDFKEGDYSTAANGFSVLINDPAFGEISTFYLGLSRNSNGEHQKAIEAFNQLLAKYPTFSQTEEVSYWMTRSRFELGDFPAGVRQAQELDSETRKALFDHYLSDLSFGDLKELYSRFEGNRELAAVLIKQANREELTDEDEFLVQDLRLQLGIAAEELGDFPVVKKSSYSIAVFLPFLFDGLDQAEKTIRNELVLDLYLGMKLGMDYLSQQELPITIFPYDTRRDSSYTNAVLRSRDLEKVDAIIGPLFPKPNDLVRNFASEKQINQINPVSSNSVNLIDNPHSFLLKPDYQTIARKTAAFMNETAKKKEVKIYFENKPAEKTIAKAYKEAIEELGMNVTEFLPIDIKTARQVLAQFTDQEELVLNIDAEEALRLQEEGRLVRDRRKYDARGNLITKEDGSPSLEYYEMIFTAQTDSLDHMFAVTRSNVLANNFVGAVESIADTVRLVGLGDWLNFSMLDFRQLERLGVNLIHTEYYDRNSPFFNEVNEAFKAKYKKQPTDFALLGFESVWWVGNMLHRHGKYFQNGFLEEQDFPSVFYGHEFSFGANDNQIVPIVQFVEQQLRPVNFKNESGEE